MEQTEINQVALRLACRMLPDELLRRVVDYCLAAGPPWCYPKWPRPLLKEYLAFHALHRTLAWTADVAPEDLVVTGAGVAWQTSEDWIHQRESEGKHVFDWIPSDPNGDSLFLADFIGSRPGTIRNLLNTFDTRWPEWRRLKFFSYRKGKLVRMNGTRFERRYLHGVD